MRKYGAVLTTAHPEHTGAVGAGGVRKGSFRTLSSQLKVRYPAIFY